MRDFERCARLVERATFGPRPGQLDRLRAVDPEEWVERELEAARGADPDLERRLRAFDSRGFDPESFLSDIDFPYAMGGAGAAGDGQRRAVRREVGARTREVSREMAGVRVVRAVHGGRGLAEVMIDFWANHFSVFARKGLVGGLLPPYQRDVIERHALGRFEDLLLAVARSPAMLVYLDNWISTSARPRGGGRRGGINENYARELLELHTVGADGGYAQRDVIEVARVLTGWTLESPRRPVFRFRPGAHDRGPKRVMGEPVPGGGVREGEALLVRLARHPSTARHVARKLVRRFVDDAPPPALVERAARRFLDSGGDIPAVLRTVLLSPELADGERRKLKTPLRFVASALRATGGETDGGPPILLALGRLGEVPFFARVPAGYPETAAHWADPGAMLERMTVSFALSRRRLRGTRLGDETLVPLDSLGGVPRAERMAVALAAPEFQWT